jgi:hypothetical protein
MRRAAAAVALAAALCLALPAEAAGFHRGGETGPGLIERAWSWLAGWIEPDAPKPGGWANAVGKDGIHIDPDGRNAVNPCPADGCASPDH